MDSFLRCPCNCLHKEKVYKVHPFFAPVLQVHCCSASRSAPTPEVVPGSKCSDSKSREAGGEEEGEEKRGR